jgi:methyl-accepting chemotaxis protein
VVNNWFSHLKVNKKLAWINGIVVFLALSILVVFLSMQLTEQLERMTLNNIDVSEANEGSLDKATLLNALREEQKEVEELKVKLEITVMVASLVTLMVIVFLNLILVRFMLRPLDRVKQAMEAINQGVLGKRLVVESQDEIGNMCHSFNVLAVGLQELIGKMQESTEFLENISNSMGVSTKNVSNLAVKQGEGLRGIVQSMDSSDHVAKLVTIKAKEVSKIAGETKKNVDGGCAIISSTMEKIGAIKEYGRENVESTKKLNEKMNLVSDIVKTINGIASQTKMIAFNAELEAAAAGEAGKNFKIVATEIRRLSDSIMHATSGIKLRLLEAQAVVDFIIVSSEESGVKIKEGWDESIRLNKVFDTILTSSEVSATSAEEIAQSIQELVRSFSDVLETLRVLSNSIEGFSELAEVANFTSGTVSDIGSDFKHLISKFTTTKST